MTPLSGGAGCSRSQSQLTVELGVRLDGRCRVRRGHEEGAQPATGASNRGAESVCGIGRLLGEVKPKDI